MHPYITTSCGCLYASLHNDFVRPPSCILCTFMNALWALRPCKAFGRSFYKASVPYPQVACSPSRRTKNNTPLVERGIIFGADGGGRTRTVLLPTDFESVTSANSITPANMFKFCTYISLTHFLNGFKRENHIILKI